MARPNAIIEEWLAEWRDEAKQKGHQSQHTFAKALASLRAYPLAITSGSECQILKNFGPALCTMIDKRLAQERKNSSQSQKPGNSQNSANNVKPSQISESVNLPATSANKKTPRKTSKAIKHSQETNTDGESDGEAREAAAPTSPKKRARVATKPKEYIPAYRSGAYAILVALLEHSRDPSATRSYMTKTELIEAAQLHSDTSFKPQARGGMPMGPSAFFYCAWSSMSTLIKKCLVEKEGNPARFMLSESGKQLADRLLLGNANSQTASVHPEVEVPKQSNKPPTLKQSSSNSNDASSSTASASTSKITFTSSSKTVSSFSSENYAYSGDFEDDTSSSSFPKEIAIPKMTRLPSKSNPQSTTSTVPKLVKMPSSSRSQPLQSDDMFIGEVFDLLAGCDSAKVPSWEVVLCVDNQEYYGNFSKKAIITDLMKLGVRTEVRHLSVGDYLWVLRRRSGFGAANSANGDDIVLDYVMERKRIDDLVSSIVDGRYKEQKARLRNSGRPRTVYLVEEFTAWAANTTGWKLSINPATLLQSVMNTLIIDEFELRMTRDGHHTAVMLAAVSRHIEATMHKIARKCQLSTAVTVDQKSTYLSHPISTPVRFADWNAASSKRRAMTVREIFARQLMCIQGVSADRAIAITSLYPLPAKLMEACSVSETDCEKSIATLKIGTRKLGPALGKRLAAFYSHF